MLPLNQGHLILDLNPENTCLGPLNPYYPLVGTW